MAYAFSFEWGAVETLLRSNVQTDELYGSAVAAGSNRIFVGAPLSDSGAGKSPTLHCVSRCVYVV